MKLERDRKETIWQSSVYFKQFSFCNGEKEKSFNNFVVLLLFVSVEEEERSSFFGIVFIMNYFSNCLDG